MYMSTDVGGHKVDVVSMPEKNERFSGFSFIVVRCSLPHSPFASPLAIPIPTVQYLTNVHQKELPDPTRGYHLLILMHYRLRRDGT
jgi:hypothetical protein